MYKEDTGFYITRRYNKDGYGIAIDINHQYYTGNLYMNELLDMTKNEYMDLVHTFNGSIYNYFNSITFSKKENAQKFADYLNDKYLVLIKLQGKL